MCDSCEHLNVDESAFCTRCGSRLSGDDPEDAGPRLVMLYGEDREVIFPLDAASTTIGRHRENDIILNDKMISKHHAEIFSAESDFFIRDLESKNGVFVNGDVVKEPSRLSNGSLIKIGYTLVRFEYR